MSIKKANFSLYRITPLAKIRGYLICTHFQGCSCAALLPCEHGAGRQLIAATKAGLSVMASAGRERALCSTRLRNAVRKVLLALAVLAPLSVWAEWVKVNETQHGTACYVDPTTIKGTGEFRRVWELLDYSAPGKSGNLSLSLFVEYNCKEHQVRALQATGFSGHMSQGNVLNISEGVSAWEDIAPGTVNESIMRYICVR